MQEWKKTFVKHILDKKHPITQYRKNFYNSVAPKQKQITQIKAKYMSRHLTEEYMYIANRCMKRCLSLLIIR